MVYAWNKGFDVEVDASNSSKIYLYVGLYLPEEEFSFYLFLSFPTLRTYPCIRHVCLPGAHSMARHFGETNSLDEYRCDRQDGCLSAKTFIWREVLARIEAENTEAANSRRCTESLFLSQVKRKKHFLDGVTYTFISQLFSRFVFVFFSGFSF